MSHPLPPQAPYAAAIQPQPKNGFGTTALVLGITGLVLAFIPFVGIVAWPLVILGLIFGALGIARARKGHATNKGAAISGTVLSVAGLVVCIVWVAAIGYEMEQAAGNPPAAPPAAEAGQAADAAATPDTAGLNQPVADGAFTFTVTKVESGVPSVVEGAFAEQAQGQFVLVHLTIQNTGDTPGTFFGANQYLYDAEGRKHATSTAAAIWMQQNANSLWEPINPGNTVDGVVVFDVPPNAQLRSIELHDSMISQGVTVSLGG